MWGGNAPEVGPTPGQGGACLSWMFGEAELLEEPRPGEDAGGRCSVRSGWPLVLVKVRLVCEGCQERSQLWCQKRGQRESSLPRRGWRPPFSTNELTARVMKSLLMEVTGLETSH